jgi:hypothetical protein
MEITEMKIFTKKDENGTWFHKTYVDNLIAMVFLVGVMVGTCLSVLIVEAK